MAAIELFEHCNPLSMGGIRQLKLATRDNSENPLDFPMDVVLKTNDEAVLMMSDNEETRTINIGSNDVQYRIVLPLHANLSENEITNRQGRFYEQILEFEMPQINLTTNNQLKSFLFSSGGEFAISNMICFIEDMNGKLWCCGYAQPMVLDSFQLIIGAKEEDNKYSLKYICKSYSKIRQCEFAYPSVTTDAIYYFGGSSVIAGGNVVNEGKTAIIERGIVWNMIGLPTLIDNKIVVSGTTGAFTTSITGLTTGVYYVRAYATNSEGTAYGQVRTFTVTQIATVVTSGHTYSSGTTAILKGNVTVDGLPSITERGFVYGLGTIPVIGDVGVTKISTTGTIGAYQLQITGLTYNTYYYRAYAINSVGTAYGDVKSFLAQIYPLTPMGRWKFNNTFGSTPAGITLTNTGSYRFVSGLMDKAYHPNSNTTTLWTSTTPIVASMSGTYPFTISCWLYLEDVGDSFVILDSGSFKIEFVDSSGLRLYYTNRDGSTVSEILVSPTVWAHLVLMFSGTDTKIYINNVLKGTVTENDSITVYTIYFVKSQENAMIYDRYMDLLYYYTRILTTDEIALLYNGGIGC
jgi:hypothetical protein